MRRILVSLALALTALAPHAVMAQLVDSSTQQMGDGTWFYTYDDTPLPITSPYGDQVFQVVSITSSNETQRGNSHLTLTFTDPTTDEVVLTVDRPAAPGSVVANLRNNNPQIIAVHTPKGYIALAYRISGGWG